MSTPDVQLAPARAFCQDRVVAESRQSLRVDDQIYFPLESLDPQLLRPSSTMTHCPLRGPIRYFHLMVDDILHLDAVCCFPHPQKCMECIRDHAAFTEEICVES